MDGISSIIIDGYNLIGLGHGDLQAARGGLINALALYRKSKGHDITVVFDGWQAGSHREEKTIVSGITVIYSRLGDRADLVIKRIISSAAKEWIVVTSDRDIASHAWATGSVPVPSAVFEAFMEGHRPASPDGIDSAEEDEPQKRKGKARTASRKEKAIARVLKKL